LILAAVGRCGCFGRGALFICFEQIHQLIHHDSHLFRLARELFNTVEIDQEVPEVLYTAVAEVLAYVYSRRNPGG
jgi:hypothetical protein